MLFLLASIEGLLDGVPTLESVDQNLGGVSGSWYRAVESAVSLIRIAR